MKQGDAIAFETTGWFAGLIRFGQRFLARSNNYRFTHIAIVEEVLEGNDAWLIQAAREINRVKLSSYGETPHRVLPFRGFSANSATYFAYKMLGMKYGITTVISKAINYITPSWIRLTGERRGRMDCSVFVARCWEHGGYVFPQETDVWLLSPSDLVDTFGYTRVNERVGV